MAEARGGNAFAAELREHLQAGPLGDATLLQAARRAGLQSANGDVLPQARNRDGSCSELSAWLGLAVLEQCSEAEERWFVV